MSGDVRLLVMSGSSRTGSYNLQLASVAAEMARGAGAEVHLLDLRALELPVYDGDIERAGLPDGAWQLRDAFAGCDAVLFTSPEYNGYPTPLLLNALDWASRVPDVDGRPSGLAVIGGKVAGVMSASPGGGGGLRSLIAFRQFLQLSLGLLVAPEQYALSQAGKAFDEAGGLIDPAARQAVHRVVASVLRTAGALKQPVTAPGDATRSTAAPTDGKERRAR